MLLNLAYFCAMAGLCCATEISLSLGCMRYGQINQTTAKQTRHNSLHSYQNYSLYVPSVPANKKYCPPFSPFYCSIPLSNNKNSIPIAIHTQSVPPCNPNAPLRPHLGILCHFSNKFFLAPLLPSTLSPVGSYSKYFFFLSSGANYQQPAAPFLLSFMLIDHNSIDLMWKPLDCPISFSNLV